MAYSYAIEQAIRAASVLHKDHVRKGRVPYPYITHLFAVTLIVSDYTNDENTLVAALLHATLEDTDYTEKELEEDFGGPVREIVHAISDIRDSYHNKADQEAYEKQYFKRLRSAREESLIVLAANKIHEMRSIVEEYYEDHSAFIAEYGDELENILFRYQEISNVLNRSLKNAILSEFNSVFTEYKNFIHDVEEKQNEY
jgi:(p)ppGpp synthase/HD superfamily hydrolase